MREHLRRRRLYRVSRHRFDPFFESTGDCWCGHARQHRIHRGDAQLADTPLGREIQRQITVGRSTPEPTSRGGRR